MTSSQPRDFTPLVDLLAERGTGPVRERRPTYVDLLPPCNSACPAGENIQAWLALAQAGRYREAWLTLVADNPLPAVHGRVCYHPCESHCNRAQLDSAVSIHAVERFLGDVAAREGWRLALETPPSGKRVLIVGAGPSGLSAAYHLARQGHQVEIRDAGSEPGGMMRFGIPAYRLPREPLHQEVRAIEAMGVRIVPNHTVEDVLAERDAGRFDAVFVAIGAQIGRRIDLPASDAARLLTAVGLLRGSASGQPPKLGRRVVVYGAGNTAMDAARTARRLGVEEALVVFVSDRAHMEAHAFEAAEASEEGVKIRWLTRIAALEAAGLTVEEMELDASGRPQPTGRFETLSADAVVLALGQEADSAFLGKIPGIAFEPDGAVTVDRNLMTGCPGIFAGGDVAPGERTVTGAVGQGRKAARRIHDWLSGRVVEPAPKPPPVSFKMLHLPVYSVAERARQSVASPAERVAGFTEVQAGFSEQQAAYEAKRCLSCGVCFECDQCYAACPEQAIEKLGPGLRYRFLYDRCTGCAVCFETCPCHAIEMVPEPDGR
ncbi:MULTISPECIES: NAD(P)-binding protein [unclassified Phenylobacterium]|uniref:NAD(P)-binding protein n=1 Tax=unclassified Phenylobacterium TaxID=2640670 RepID=UPI00083A4667|nr:MULTISPECIES: NAD(P)-binding protein [unclassified Phenylobacterium]